MRNGFQGVQILMLAAWHEECTSIRMASRRFLVLSSKIYMLQNRLLVNICLYASVIHPLKCCFCSLETTSELLVELILLSCWKRLLCTLLWSVWTALSVGLHLPSKGKTLSHRAAQHFHSLTKEFLQLRRTFEYLVLAGISNLSALGE